MNCFNHKFLPSLLHCRRPFVILSDIWVDVRPDRPTPDPTRSPTIDIWSDDRFIAFHVSSVHCGFSCAKRRRMEGGRTEQPEVTAACLLSEDRDSNILTGNDLLISSPLHCCCSWLWLIWPSCCCCLS